jgi:hypothetical protein
VVDVFALHCFAMAKTEKNTDEIRQIILDRTGIGLMPLVRAIQSTGAVTLEAITCALNDRGVRPMRGTRWYASSVSNLLARAQKFAGARSIS